MLDINSIYHAHPLYIPLTRWQGVDTTNYFMLNDSLLAAHRYIVGLGVELSLTQNSPTIKYYQNKLQFTSNTTILALFANGRLTVPRVQYYDTTSNTFTYTNGVDVTNLPNATYTAIGTVGYVLHSEVNDTILQDANGFIPEVYPITSEDPLSLTAIGRKGHSVYVNDEEFGNIGDDGTLEITIPMYIGVDKLHVVVTDDNIVDDSTIHVVRVTTIQTVSTVVVTGYDIVTNNDIVNVTLVSNTATTIPINDIATTVTIGVNHLQLTVPLGDGAINVDGTYFPYTHLNIDEAQRTAINKNTKKVNYLPEDIKLAIFKLAQHFYNTALYNSEGRSTMNALDERTSFLPTIIPKEVHTLLAPYVTYG